MIGNFLPLTYLLLDSHFGNNQASIIARQVNLHLISKLRQDLALYFPYQNPLLTEKSEPVLLAQIFARICSLGRVYPTLVSSTPS